MSGMVKVIAFNLKKVFYRKQFVISLECVNQYPDSSVNGNKDNDTAYTRV